MFERFTVPSRETVVEAKRLAKELGHPQVGTEHLLLGLLSRPGVARDVLTEAGVTAEMVLIGINERSAELPLSAEDAEALQELGIDLSAVRARVEEAFGPGALAPPQEPVRGGLFRRKAKAGSHFSPRARKVLGLALREAIQLKHDYIGTEHLLLGILREGQGLAALILSDTGIALTELRKRTLAAISALPHGK